MRVDATGKCVAACEKLCAFGDAEVAPILSTLKYFREEYETHIREKRCPFQKEGRLMSVGH